MPRYYFHASSGFQDIPDTKGIELDSLEDVKDYVWDVAEELDIGAEWVIEVTDEGGRIQSVITASEMGPTRQ